MVSRICGFLSAFLTILPLLLVTAGPEPAKALESGDLLTEAVLAPFTGDFEEMRERRFIRVLVPLSQTYFFIDKGRLRGLTAELAHEFELHLNKTLKLKKADAITVAMIPTPRDQIISGIAEGRGDMAMANLTITDERRAFVDFANPVYKGVRELVATGPGVAAPDSLQDLKGMEIHVRRSSSFFGSLSKLNESPEFKDDPIRIVEANESLEVEELLEMVNAGLIPATIADSHILSFWQKVFNDLDVNEEVAIRDEGEIAWAIRKDSPQFMAVVNDYVEVAGKGTSIGNTLLRRYLSDTKWLKNITSDQYSERLGDLRASFEKYGGQYKIDWLIVAALAFQESKFDQNARNPSGAVGIMQIKPSTARDPNVGINDISSADDNIHAGVKYLRFIADDYFGDKEIDDFNRIMMALASYNAGPNGIARVRKKAPQPNIWFEEVEDATAKSVGIEPVRYVSNIYRYYLTLSGIVAKADADKAQ